METLLAVDTGVRTGLALFNSGGELEWYHSQNYGNKVRLKKGIGHILRSHPDLDYLILEGGGPVARIWKNAAQRFGIKIITIDAAKWREKFLFSRERRSGAMAKQHAIVMAEKIIQQSKLPLHGSLQNDAAEAVLTGVWAMMHLGWIREAPSFS